MLLVMAEQCPDCGNELIQAEYSGDPNLFTCDNKECRSYEQEFI